MVQRRRRFKELPTLSERLEQEATRLRAAAENLPPGPQWEQFLRMARQTETATHIDEWLSSPGLQAPDIIERAYEEALR
jgi:hypothetical protein